MKKFLTVLLALSVVFTYSFSAAGSVFAAASTNAEEAEKAFLKIVKEVEDDLTFTGGYYDHATDSLDGVVSRDVMNERIAEVKAQYLEAIYSATADWDSKYPATAADLLKDILGNDQSKAVFDMQIKVDIKNVEKTLDLSKRDYSAEDWTKIEGEIERIEKAIEAKQSSYTSGNVIVQAQAIKAIRGLADDMEAFLKLNNIVTIDESTDEVTKAKKAILKVLDDESANFIEKSLVYFANPAAALTATELAQKASLVKDVNALTAIFEEEIDRIMDSTLTTDGQKVTDLNAMKSVIEDTFKIAVTSNGAGAYTRTVSYFYDDLAVLDTAALLKLYAKNVADAMKEMRKEDGRLLYQAKDVDAAYEDTLTAISKGTYTEIAGGAKLSTALVDNNMKVTPATYALRQYKEDAITSITTGNYASIKWAEERKDKVEAIQEKAEDDILLAETREDIDAIAAKAKADMKAILTINQIDALNDDTEKCINALGFDELFDDYFDSVLGKTGYTALTKAEAKTAAKDFLKDLVVEKEDALLTKAEINKIITDNYKAALDVLVDVQTEEALKAAGEAVKKEIEALPKDITLDAKDAVLAAIASYESFDEQPGAIEAYVGAKYVRDLYDAEDELIYLEVKAVKAMVSAFPSVITINDEAAIVAARAAIEAIEETYGEGTTPATTIRTVEAAEAALEDAKVKDAADKIAVLKDGASKAEVEAARAAYDALSIRSKLAFNDELYADLLKAEANVKANVVASVESLKIVTSTKLYTKSNKIRVNWKVKEGDASAITGYQVYKSTKAHTNYKFMGKTTKNYMDNKKNLKKGQRYFYKVRAYVEIDGERYYSDWSNKGNRIYK